MPTELALLQTHTLLQAVETIPRKPKFFRSWFFPQDIVFGTPKVLMEYKKGSRVAAPYIAPRVNGITLKREGDMMREYEPFITGVKRVLTLDQLEQRGFGEALYSNLTPQMRQMAYLRQDLIDNTDAIELREEVACGEVIFNNSIVANEIINDFGKALPPKEIMFYAGTVNPSLVTISKDWDTTEESGKQILKDLADMIRIQRKKNLPVNLVVTGPEVMDVLLNNEHLIKRADNRQLTNTLNMVPEEMPDGVVHYLDLNINGRIISFYCYDESYFTQSYDEKGNPEVEENGEPKMVEKTFVPYGKIALGYRDVGKVAYGAISQKEKYLDDQIHTYTGKLIPRYYSPETSDDREIALRSKFIPIPMNETPFVVAQVMKEA